MTYLVTGGAGFIGSHVAEVLVKDGHDVVVLDDLSGGFVENLPEASNLKFVNGSINNVDLLDTIFQENDVNTIYHFAAYAAEGLSHFIKRFNYHNNLIGSVNLINAAINHGVRTFVFTSSIAVYGKNQLPMTEELVPNPEDPYGVSKFAVEKELEISKKMFDLDYIIFRPHNVYGERQNIWDRYRNVIGIFINQILQGKPLTIFGDGNQTRAFTYIRDIAPLIAHSINDQKVMGNIFNIGSDEVTTVKELAEVIQNLMGVDLPIKYLDERPEVKHAFPSHKKLYQYFSEGQHTPLREGLSQMIRWARQAPTKESVTFTNIEISRNLPLSWR